MSIQQEDPITNLMQRVESIEDGFKMYKSRQENLGKEVKVILAEIHIITEWIHQRFGVELLNKNSFLFKHIHDFDEVAEISATLCLLANVAGNATKYTGAELAAAAAAAAAGNAAAAAAAENALNRQELSRGGYTGSTASSPVSPSPTSGPQGGAHRIRVSSLPPPEHPPRPISTPPMISGQPLSSYHHQQHSLLIPQQGCPVPAHSASMHHTHLHPHLSQHASSHSHASQAHNPQQQQIHLHHIPQQTPSSTTITVQHHQQYILPHSPTNSSSTSHPGTKLSPQNLPPPLPPPQSHSGSSPNSPTNLSQSQLIISKKSKPPHQPPSSILSPCPGIPATAKILLPPPPPPPLSQTSSASNTPMTPGKNTAPVSVVTLVATAPSQNSPPSTYHHPHHSSSSSAPSTNQPTVTLQVQQPPPPPPPPTPTVTHISVPPKKSLSSRNAHNISTSTAHATGTANIKKYFKPLVIVQQQQESSMSSSRPPSPPTIVPLQHQKPNSTTGTLVESHSTIGQVYVFSDANEDVPIISNNIDAKDDKPTMSSNKTHERMDTSTEDNNGSFTSNVQVRPVTPVNPPNISTPDADVLRPKRRNRKKGYGSNKSARHHANNGGRSPNHNTNSLDYTADTEDEVPTSRDSTPVSVNKRKTLGSPKPLKTSTPITTTPKSSKQQQYQPLRSSTPAASAGTGGQQPGIIAESPIPGPSHSAILNSSSNCSSRDSSKHQQSQSGGEESSSTGTSEKLPKRGRPKKRPEERVRTYDPRVPMQCDECGKVLKGTGALRVHKQIHQNIRPYDCTVCGRAFRRKHHLEFHMMIHEGNKKETCSYCGKAFLIRRDLARHERTHTGEKPYSCHLCPKSFNVKQHLTLHIRTHTGERPYRCPICDKTFTQANSLRIHKKIHLRDRERAEGASGPNAAAGSGGTTGTVAGGTGNKGKGKGGGAARSNSASSTSTNSTASNSSTSSSGGSSSATTSGISSASTSALETPERVRPPSSGGGGSRVASPSPSLRSGQSSPPSPAVRQHPLLQHVHIPPPVAETVTVVTSPPAHLTSHTFDNSRGELRGEHAYHGATAAQPSSPPTTWRLSLNPGSGTNLISPPGANSSGNRGDSRTPPPPPTFSIPAAHQVQPSTGGNPGHYAVIRNMVSAAPVGGSGGEPRLVRAYIPSPESHHHGSGDGRSPSSPAGAQINTVPAHHNQNIHHGQSASNVPPPPNASGGTTTYTIYDPANVTRYYN